MKNLRNEAQGRDCLIRLPGICNFDPATTVLAHYRLIGVSGAGLKSPDLCGAWACSACHTYVDTHDDDATARAHLEGMVRTIAVLTKEGTV